MECDIGTRNAQNCGDPQIDAVRAAMCQGPPSDLTGYCQALVMGNAWLHLLQRQGLDTSAVLPAYDALAVAAQTQDQAAALVAVAAFFASLERIAQERPSLVIQARDPALASPSGAPPRPWPMYGGDPGHRACRSEAGPSRGQRRWSHPLGLAWYAAPVVVDGRVHVASPGLRTLAWCLDLASGAVIWRCDRDWQLNGLRLGKGTVLPQSYTRQAVASQAVVLDESVVYAELGAQGRDRGQRHLLWIDRATGRVQRRVPADEADYRMGHARLAGHDGGLVLATGTQRLEGLPAQVSPHDRVACFDPLTGDRRWDLRLGPTQALPVVDDDQAYVGTCDGTVFALRLAGIRSDSQEFGATDGDRIVWSRSVGCGTNAPGVLAGDLLVLGLEDGRVMALARHSGEIRWQCPACQPEPRSQQLFSAPVVHDDRVYLGTAAATVVCLDLATGALCWTAPVDDWVRARPALVAGVLVVATLSGTLIAFEDQGVAAHERWRCAPGSHEVFADLVVSGEHLLVTDARLQLRCLDGRSGALRWSHHLLCQAMVDGQPMASDEMACGGWYQSKPTVAEGRVLVGSPGRFVVAVDVASGRRCWRSELSGAVSGAPTVVDGRVLIGQQGGANEFRCLDAATGRPLWQQQLGWVWSSATVVDHLAYLPGIDGYFTCLDTVSGAIRWRYRSGAGAHPEPPVDQGRVFFGSWDHYVYAFEALTGRLLWQFHTGGTPDSGAPIAADGRLFVPMGGRRFCCLDAATGVLLWDYVPDAGCMNGSPAYDGARVYLSTSLRGSAIPPACRIRCLDAASGTELWDVPGGGITAPVIAGGHLYTAATSDPCLACYRLRGDQPPVCLWRVAMADRVYESTPAIYAGQAFIVSEDGHLHAFT